MRFYSVTLIFSLTIVFLGCGIDDEMDNGESIESAKTPVISIRKVKEEMAVRNNREEIEVFFEIVADTAPKTDILVFSDIRGDDSSYDIQCHGTSKLDQWITIPKGRKKSQTFSEIMTLNGKMFVSIDKIPTVEFVGQKGKFVDQEKLEKYWGRHTLENKRIPDGFKFPYYEVGEPSELELYQPKDAKIIRVEPPIGSRVPKGAQIKITFDTPPLCPKFEDHSSYARATALSSTTFLVTLPRDGAYGRSHGGVKAFVFRWANPQHERWTERGERIQTFHYEVE